MLGDTAISGKGLTTTVRVVVAVQAFGAAPVMVYVVVTFGLATGLAMFGFDKPVLGTQVYVVAPLTESGVDCPAHKGGTEGAFNDIEQFPHKVSIS